MTNQTQTQKPYVSQIGNDWIVLDSNGKDAFVTRDRNLAISWFAANYHTL